MSDDNDLTDRYDEICGELEGNTLEDDIRENPDPPPGYGQPDPRTIIEQVGQQVWAWNTKESDSEIWFSGDSMEIKE